MTEIQEALDRRQAKREKLNLAREKRQEKEAVKTALRDNEHGHCRASHTWYEAIDPAGFRRDVEICSDDSLGELAWAAKRFGWKITKQGFWSERGRTR